MQQINAAMAVRKPSIVFAQALANAGVKVRRVMRSHKMYMGSTGIHVNEVVSDVMRIRGKAKFDVDLTFNYKDNLFRVRVYSKRGTQMQAVIKTFDELKALFTVWAIGNI